MKDRFHALGNLIADAYKKGEIGEAKALILRYQELARQYKTDWNYGNALHQTNVYLGLIALDNQDIETAKLHLLKAADTPGSPQLNSFGPNMLLAKRLLEAGEKEVVLTYIDKCRKFWKFIFSTLPARRWKKAINKGDIPTFGGNLYYHISYVEQNSL